MIKAEVLVDNSAWKKKITDSSALFNRILKKNSISFWNVSDHIAATAAIGIGFGRIANFINGELWGKISYIHWAVIFPQSGSLEPRHPSQIYQSICEGFLEFILILFLQNLILH